MAIRYNYLHLIICFFIFSSFQVQKEKDEILWNPSTKLTWDDFQGRVMNNSDDAAKPLIKNEDKYSTSGDTLIINIKVVFYKSKSWVKKADKTPYLLSHEQGHFDLSEIFARKLRKELSEHSKYKRKDADSYIDKTTAYYGDLLIKEQDEYDTETNHSINQTRQAEWLQKIKLELQELDAYSSTVIKKPLK